MKSSMDLFSLNSWPFYCIISVIIFIYCILTRNHNYWSKRGVKGPWPLPGLGTILYVLLKPTFKVEVNWLNRFGKIYGTFDGNIPVIRIADPKLLKQILVKDFHIFDEKFENENRHQIHDKTLNFLKGEEWKRVRSVVGSTLSPAKIKQMYPSIRKCLIDLVNSIKELSSNEKEVDMKIMFGKYSMDVITACVFGIKTQLYNNSNNEFIDFASRIFINNHVRYFLNSILPSFILRYFKITLRGREDVREFYFGVFRDTIKERKKSNKCFNDFFDLVLRVEKRENNIRDSNESHHVNEDEEDIEIQKKTFSGIKRFITENEIMANAFSFIMAGYEGIAAILSFCTYELALKPEIQDKLYSEIMSSVDSNGEIDYDLLTKLQVLDAVISETLRLHSFNIISQRIAAKDYKLGDTGITLRKGQRVEIPILAIHRCEDFYPNADQFIPERFLPENRDKLIAHTYLPFGSGPRNCVAVRLVLLELKLALTQVVQHFRIVKTMNTEIPVPLTKQTNVHTPQRVIVKMIERI